MVELSPIDDFQRLDSLLGYLDVLQHPEIGPQSPCANLNSNGHDMPYSPTPSASERHKTLFGLDSKTGKQG